MANYRQRTQRHQVEFSGTDSCHRFPEQNAVKFSKPCPKDGTGVFILKTG